jgi:putative exosortase-associated protein (TIGR04073 family)
MKFTKVAMVMVVLAFTLMAGTTHAESANEIYRQQSDTQKMLHKLGRGFTNVLTSWVEVPRNVAIEWEKTDPASGFILGMIKGFGWGFSRLVTGVYDVFTFPFPVPRNYEPMMEPEFVVSDIWGEPIPELTELSSNDPEYSGSNVHPNQFNF